MWAINAIHVVTSSAAHQWNSSYCCFLSRHLLLCILGALLNHCSGRGSWTPKCFWAIWSPCKGGALTTATSPHLPPSHSGCFSLPLCFRRLHLQPPPQCDTPARKTHPQTEITSSLHMQIGLKKTWLTDSIRDVHTATGHTHEPFGNLAPSS